MALRKISLCLLFLFCFQLENQAQTNNAKTSGSLKSVLGKIEKEFGVFFSYDPSEIKSVDVAFNINKDDLRATLTDLLSSTQLTFEQVDQKFYVIKQTSSKFIQLKVVDQESSDALAFATVKQKNTNQGIVTNEQGQAKIVVPSSNEGVLEVTYLGFKTQELKIDSLPENSDLLIRLNPEPIGLNDYEIKEYLNAGITSDPKANSFKILPQEMEILPGLSERDVLLSTQIISGVNSNDESASGINLRGSSRDNTLLYWNNVPIYHSAHYFGHISSFIPSSIAEVDVYKNFIPIKYGGASAGIIALSSRNEIDEAPKTEANMNMTHADIFLKRPLFRNKSSLMLAFRRSYNDIIPTWTFNAYGTKLFNSEIRDREGVLIRDDFSNDLKFNDINLNWNFEPSDRTTLKLNYIKSNSQFNFIQNDPENRLNIRQEHSIQSSGLDLSWVQRITTKSSINSSFVNSQYHMAYAFLNFRKPNFPEDDDIESRSNQINNMEGRFEYVQSLNTKIKFNIGYQYNDFDIDNLINTENFLKEDQAEEINSNTQVHGLFTDFNWQLSDRTEVVLSQRITYVESLNQSYLSPQLKLNYTPTRNLLLKSSLGIYHQYLSTIKESQFTISNALEQHWLMADRENHVPIIINRQASFGGVYSFQTWLIDIDFYQKHIQGLLARNLGFGFTREAGFNQGEEDILGIDITLRKRWKYFKTWLSYNFQNSEVSFKELFPQAFPSNLNIRNQFNVSTSYSKRNWEISLGYIYKSGAPYTSLENVRIRERDQSPLPPPNPDDANRDRFRLEFSRPNSLRLPNYHRFDASIWHRFKGQNWNGEIGLSMMNVFNRRNVYDIGYIIDFNREGKVAILEKTKFFLEFTPNLSLRFNF